MHTPKSGLSVPRLIAYVLFDAGLSAGFVLDILHKAGFRAKENLIRTILIHKLKILFASL